jgi:hypothetical protein
MQPMGGQGQDPGTTQYTYQKTGEGFSIICSLFRSGTHRFVVAR